MQLVPLARSQLSLTPVADVLATSGDVYPSGDTTGATDVAAVNYALQSKSVRLTGDYYINAAITIPSNRMLLLADASITLVAGAALGNMITNSNLATGNTNIRIVGQGRALIKGNGAAAWAAHQDWRWICLLLVKVTGFEIGNVQFQQPVDWNISPQNCENGYIHDLEFINTPNGMQLLGGNRDIVIEGLRGYTQDDVVAVETDNALSYDSTYAYDGIGSGEVADIAIRDVQVKTPVHLVRLINSRNSPMHRINVSGIRFPANSHDVAHAGCGSCVLGQSTYVATPPLYTEMYDISFDDCEMFLEIGQSCSNVKLTNIRIPSYGAPGSASYEGTNYFNYLVSVTGATTKVVNLEVNGAQINASYTAGSSVLTSVAGSTLDQVTLKNLYVFNVDALLNNAGTVTNLLAEDIFFQRLAVALATSVSPERGRVSNVTVGTFAGSARYPALLSLQFGPNMPTLTSADTAPLPISGSEVLCDSTKVLDGGAATAAKYLGDGSGWNRVVSFPAYSTLGKTTIGGSTASFIANNKTVFSAVLGGNASVKKLSVYLSGAATANAHLKAVIYADSAGSPAALLATGVEATIAKGDLGSRWLDLPFAAPVALTAATYWIGWIASADPGCAPAYDAGGARAGNTNTYGTPSNPFGSVTTGGSFTYSVYATYS